MPYPLDDQRLAFATNPAAILVLRRRSARHRTHPRLAPLERQRRPQQRLAVDPVGLGASAAPRNRDRGRVHHVALDPFLLQRPMDPEPVEPGFLNDDDRIANSRPSRSLLANSRKTSKQAGKVARVDPMPRHPLPAGDERSDQPFRTAQFQRDENGANMPLDSGGSFVWVKGHRSSPE
jgi:hypothetical protein